MRLLYILVFSIRTTKKSTINIIAGQEYLRSKRELIEGFIDSHLMKGLKGSGKNKRWMSLKGEGLVGSEVKAVGSKFTFYVQIFRD